MLELLLCSAVTILPDFLYRRFVQGKRLGREITLFSVWYELRWGITFCVILTVLLITTIFYFHPSTSSAVSVFRTVTILPETNGRVAETYVNINQRVAQGQPLFRLDSTEQEAAIETAKRRIAEVDATMQVATAQLAEADGQIAHARGALQQALDEFSVRAELMPAQPGRHPAARRRPGAGAGRHPAGPRRRRARRQGGACRPRSTSSCRRRRRAPRPRCARPRSSSRRPSSSPAPTASSQQFALRAGDVVNPMLRPAGILVPDRHATGLVAGFGQIEAQVIKVGMVGEVACVGDALHGRPDGDDRRAGRDRLGPDPPDRPAVGRRGLRRSRHDHRDHGAALRRALSTACRRAAPASPTPTPPTTTRSRTRRSAPSTPSSCTRSTPPASSTPRSSGCRR